MFNDRSVNVETKDGEISRPKKVFAPQPKDYFCWVACDRSRSWIFSATSNEDAENQAGRYFGVSPIRIMSRRST